MTTLHILDDHLEAYSLGRFAAAATAPAEEHLLACADCRDRLARWDEYIRAMRAAWRTFCDGPLRRAAGLSPD
jgi:anti-sigma factor RsiW